MSWGTLEIALLFLVSNQLTFFFVLLIEDDDFTPALPGTVTKKNWEEEDKNDDDAPASWEEATETKVFISAFLRRTGG